MIFKIKKIISFSVFIIVSMHFFYRQALAVDKICNLVIVFDDNDTEENNAQGPIMAGLAQAIYQKQAPIFCSGYTLQRYFKNMIMLKTFAASQKNETYKSAEDYAKYIEQHAKDTATFPASTKIDVKLANGSSKKMTLAEYANHAKQNLLELQKHLRPNQWVFREKEMQLTVDQWFVYRKNKSNLFLLIPKGYLASQGAPNDPAQVGLDISSYINVTAHTEAFYHALPETESDFEAKYPTELKPPLDPKQPESLIPVDDIKNSLIPGVSHDDENPTKVRFLWIIFLLGHGSVAGGFSAEYIEQIRKNHKIVCDNIKIIQKNIEIVKDNIVQKEQYEKDLRETIDKKKNYEENLKLLEKGVLSAQNTAIAGLHYNDFQKLLSVFSTHVNTLFLYYVCCYGGGYNRTVIGKLLKNIMANFIVATGVLTDQTVSVIGWKSWYLQSKKGEALKLGFDLDLKKYFDELKAYFTFQPPSLEAIKKKRIIEKKAIKLGETIIPESKIPTLENALRSITYLNEIILNNNAPFLRFPNGDTFIASKLNKKVYHLSNADAKKHVLEKKAFDLSKYEVVLLSSPYITVPITIEKACFSSIMPPSITTLVEKTEKKSGKNYGKTQLYIPKKFVATHYFNNITSNNSFNEALARNFLQGLGIYTKCFLIEEFKSTDRPKINNLIIKANRSEKTTFLATPKGTATITWVENNKGYRKTFDLQEKELVTVHNLHEHDINNILKTMAAAPETSISEDNVIQEFNDIKTIIEKEIKFDEPDKKIALSKSFIEKLDTLIKQNPHTFDIALHEAVTKPLSPTYTKASRIALISQLLQRGANPMIPDKTGETAVQKAQKLNDPDILAVFIHFVSAVKSASKKEDPALVKLLLSLKLLQQKLEALALKLKNTK